MHRRDAACSIYELLYLNRSMMFRNRSMEVGACTQDSLLHATVDCRCLSDYESRGP